MDKFLNIYYLTLLFEEYYDNYQTIKSELNEAEKVLGDIGIKWNFDI